MALLTNEVLYAHHFAPPVVHQRALLLRLLAVHLRRCLLPRDTTLNATPLGTFPVVRHRPTPWIHPLASAAWTTTRMMLAVRGPAPRTIRRSHLHLGLTKTMLPPPSLPCTSPLSPTTRALSTPAIVHAFKCGRRGCRAMKFGASLSLRMTPYHCPGGCPRQVSLQQQGQDEWQ